MEIVTQADKTSRTSTAKSWLAVLALAAGIFGIIRGVVALWDKEDLERAICLPSRAERWYYGFWTAHDWLIEILILALAAVALFAIVRRLGRNTPRPEGRALALGSSVLYLPSLFGSLPAAIGIVSEMFTPFLGGGLISIVAAVLQRVGLTHDMGDWIAKGVVSPSRDYDLWWSESRFTVAQSLVALGLAVTIIGFIQVFRAYRQKRLQTQGLYATIRHPQHMGIALWTFGLAFAVNGTAAYMTWFTVLYLYVVLALWEETHLARQFGSAYDGYRRSTPFIIPFVNIGLPLPKANVPRVAALIAYYVVGMVVLCLIMQAIGVQHPDFL